MMPKRSFDDTGVILFQSLEEDSKDEVSLEQTDSHRLIQPLSGAVDGRIFARCFIGQSIQKVMVLMK